MNIIEYINNPMRTAVTIDQALMLIDSKCSAEYDTLTPTKDSKILKDRFGVECVLVDKTLVFNVTEEMVKLVNEDRMNESIKNLGLDIKKFRI